MADLIELCDKDVVKRAYQGFYRALAAGPSEPRGGTGLGLDAGSPSDDDVAMDSSDDETSLAVLAERLRG